MIAAVVGCGESAKNWAHHTAVSDYFAFDRDLMVYGVNDAEKWGWSFDKLVVVNGPHQFTTDRMEYIRKCPASKLYTHAPAAWTAYFPTANRIRLTEFNPHALRLKKDLIYKSKTSPFVAMSMAFNDGATEINLFGVDFNYHKVFHRGTRPGDKEIERYVQFSEKLAKAGTKVRVTKESALSKFIDTI